MCSRVMAKYRFKKKACMIQAAVSCIKDTLQSFLSAPVCCVCLSREGTFLAGPFSAVPATPPAKQDYITCNMTTHHFTSLINATKV